MKRTEPKRIAVTFWVDPMTKLAMEAQNELNWSAVLRNAVDQKLFELRDNQKRAK
jgi:hypothetical protein